MKPSHLLLKAVAAVTLVACTAAQASSAVLENQALRADVDTAEGTITLLDKKTGVGWALGPAEVTRPDGSVAALRPSGLIQRRRGELRYRAAAGEVVLKLIANPPALDYAVTRS